MRACAAGKARSRFFMNSPFLSFAHLPFIHPLSGIHFLLHFGERVESSTRELRPGGSTPAARTMTAGKDRQYGNVTEEWYLCLRAKIASRFATGWRRGDWLSHGAFKSTRSHQCKARATAMIRGRVGFGGESADISLPRWSRARVADCARSQADHDVTLAAGKDRQSCRCDWLKDCQWQTAEKRRSRFKSGRSHQGNNFLSCYATPKTLNMDVVRTRMPEKLLFDKVSEDEQA